jgi:hypothetical protein
VLCVVPSKRHIVFVTAPATWDASHVVTLVGQREGATNVICCGVRGGDSSIGWHTIEVDPQNALRLVPRSPVVFNSVLAAVGAVSIVGAVLVSWGFLLLAGLLLLLFSLPRNTLSFRFSADGISAHHDEEQRWSVARPHHVVGVRLNLTTDPDAVEYVSLHVRDATVGAPFGAFPLDLSGGPAEALALAGQLEQRGIRCERMCTVNGMPATFSAVTFDAPPALSPPQPPPATAPKRPASAQERLYNRLRDDLASRATWAGLLVERTSAGIEGRTSIDGHDVVVRAQADGLWRVEVSAPVPIGPRLHITRRPLWRRLRGGDLLGTVDVDGADAHMAPAVAELLDGVAAHLVELDSRGAVLTIRFEVLPSEVPLVGERGVWIWSRWASLTVT